MRHNAPAPPASGTQGTLPMVALTLLVVAALFGGYWLLLRSGTSGSAVIATPEELPSAGNAGGALQVGSMEVPGGGAIALTTFDPHTGRPRESFRCETYSPVPGSRNELHVTKPEISLRLPSGMIATISGEVGQLRVERVDSNRGRPSDGHLEGNARIVIDRETSADRTPPETRPQDLITIESPRLQFDLAAGTLETSAALRAFGREFDIRGSGLQMTWNAGENRVEELTITQGESLTLLLGGDGLLGGSPDSDAPATAPASGPAPLASAPATPAKPRRAGGYECRLLGSVSAEQWSDGKLVGGLDAERLLLRFEEGGQAEDMLGGRRRGAASRPVELDGRNKLTVRWKGAMKLTPAAPVGRWTALPPRRVEAQGEVVTLRTPDGEIRCGGLRFHDGEQRVWLAPLADGRVRVDFRGKLQASAASVHLALDARRLKLLGDVRIDSGDRGAAAGGERMRVTCTHWAELHLSAPAGGSGSAAASTPAAPTPAAPTAALTENSIERAHFVGDAVVHVGQRHLSADQIEAAFAPVDAQRPAAPLEERMSWMVAVGGAALRDADQSLRAGWVRVEFEPGADGKSAPRRVSAEGDMALRGRAGEFSASGRRLEADLAPDRPLAQALRQATVLGAAGRPARVAAQGYRVRGARIELSEADLDAGTLLLRVPGDSHLRFASRRSLRGVARERAALTRVHAREMLSVDLRPGRNLVELSGAVDARDGDEQILADALLIELADAPVAEAADEKSGPLGGVLAMLTGDSLRAARGVTGAMLRDWRLWERTARGLPPAGERPVARIAPKEPRRATARNAVVQSETYVAGDSQPLVHQSVSAPEIELLFAQRTITTRGETRMYLTSRRMDDDPSAAADVSGLPSAMLTRGPSQTVLRCERGLVYTLGPDSDGPRVDTISLDGGVKMRHVAGREMVNLEQMLPQVARDPAQLARLTSRNTYLEADQVTGSLIGAAAGGGAAGATGAGLQMQRLNATGRVFLSDQLRDSIRSLEAARVEFDRVESLIRVFGDSTADARIFNQDRRSGQLDTPFVGPEASIDLKTNAVRAGRFSGQVSGEK